MSFEEGIGLFGFKGEVAQLVNDEQIIAAQAVDEPVCERSASEL